MKRWIVTIVAGCLMLSTAPELFAQTPGGAFEQMSPGNQKIARSLFEAQRTQLPPGTRPLTLDQISARKQSGQGWGRVFDGMKSQGLVDAKNLGQTVSSFNQRHHVASTGTVTTASNRTLSSRGAPAGGGTGPKMNGTDRGKGTVTASNTPSRGATSAQVHGAAATGGVSHGGGRGK